MEMEKITNYIGGKLQASISSEWLENVNPATGKVYSLIARSNQEDVELAIEAAKNAQISWGETPAQTRSNLMLRLADLMEREVEKLALAESIDNGKPLQVALSVDIPRAISNIRFFATAILHTSTESHQTDNRALNYTLRQPVGICVCISPWNLPLYLFTWKIAPALAAGNVVLAKPSEVTPMTAYLFSKLCIEAGFPAGVLNILHGLGNEVGAAMIAHPLVKAISFTGGTSTGAAIAKVAAPQFKKLSLELGGKNPTLVFKDCNFNNTVNEVVRAAFSNQGQICLCGSRILIEEEIYEKFKTAFIQKVSALKVGNPLENESNIGAIVSEPHMQKVLNYIELAKSEGGKLLTGGNRLSFSGETENGFYIEPTVFENLSNDCKVNQEEIFGPVVTLQSFKSTEEAISLANDTQYGLAASVWTESITTAQNIALRLQMGIVWVNCWMLRDLRTPFGGVKSSGVGREGGWEALRFFTEAKNVCIKY
jgi:aminomuconate-semialdehyde/2-hydroxymuconate-6-semialdehyde dehydrogenase